MPRRSDEYHGGGSGWRFSWRPDRMQRLHELGQEFALTEDSAVRPEALPAVDDGDPDPVDRDPSEPSIPA